jgi:RNA polymerase sigma-70 factor (ECF subfamily)
METLSDDRLVTLAKNGDMDAFTELALRHKERIFKTVSLMTKNRQDADDLCQEVFLHVYKNLKEFKGRSGFDTWVYRIAVHRTVNFLKKEKGRKREAKSRSRNVFRSKKKGVLRKRNLSVQSLGKD